MSVHDDVRFEFERVGCHPTWVDENTLEALCPVCIRLPGKADTRMRVLIGEDGYRAYDCPNGCAQIGIAEVLDRLTGEARSIDCPPAPPSTDDEANPRYTGRRVDLVALLALSPKPTPWRVESLVADGTLTMISAEGGAGKSWLAQALCEGVHAGGSVAGLDCEEGVALYVDAEMGSAMFVDRLRSSGATGHEYQYRDAMGLDVSRKDDLRWIRGEIEATKANLVVMDSLRRLTPSKAENDSDDMAPVIGNLAKLSRDTGAAIVVVHHKGEAEKLFRGSSAIQNQVDALFGLQRDEGDPEGPLRHLSCPVAKGAKRPRYAPQAADVWLNIDPDTGKLSEADSPDLPAVPEMLTAAATVTDAILAVLPVRTKDEAAKKVDRREDDPTFRTSWRALRDAERLSKKKGWWCQTPRDQDHHPLLSTEVASNGHGHLDQQATTAIHTEKES